MHSSSSSQIQNALLLNPAAQGVINAELKTCYLAGLLKALGGTDNLGKIPAIPISYHTDLMKILVRFVQLTHVDYSNHSRHSDD